MTRRSLSWLLFVALCGAPGSAMAQANPPPQAAEVRARLGRILGSPEFAAPSPVDNRLIRFIHWLQEKWDAIKQFLDRILSIPALGGGSGHKWIVYIGVCVLGLWLILKLLREFRFARRPAKAGLTSVELHNMLDDMASTEPDAWLRQADKFAGEQDYRRAFRSVFVAVLLHLNSMDIVRFERSRTNGDYVRAVRSKGSTPLIEIFLPLTLEFENRWYGRRQTTESDYRRCLDQYARIRGILGSHPEPAAHTAGGR